MADWLLAYIVIGLALLFAFTNGVQDGSSVSAGVISCRALSPARAVLLVALCELLGALFGGSAVAKMVGSVTTLPPSVELLRVLVATLLTATLWNYIIKLLRFPSSSTHALFGALLGAAVAAGGPGAIDGGTYSLLHPTGMARAIVSLIGSPIAGFVAGYALLGLTNLALLRATTKANKVLQVLQILALCVMAFGHGSNDPQKTMGIIMLALKSAHLTDSTDIPLWARAGSGIAISLGVIATAPGIVRRVGKIYKLKMVHGFALEVAAGAILLISSLSGFPVSTSQIVSSTVMGIGSNERVKDVHWLVARDILVSWFLTMPCTGLVAALVYELALRGLTVVQSGT